MPSPHILLKQRQSLIRMRLETAGRVLTGELTREFGVSDDTIRRDLRDMAAAGLCRRVYGGAMPLSPGDGSFGGRLKVASGRKQALAEATARFIEEGMTVFLDAGSINVAITRSLPPGVTLTVATNAPVIAAALLDRPDTELIVIGDRIDRYVGGTIGAGAVRDAQALRPDLCVIGTCGVDREVGLTAFSFEDCEFKRFIARRSRSVLSAVTSDKIAIAAPHVIMPLSQVDRLVVEHDADSQAVTNFAASGINVLRAEPPKDAG